MLTSLALIFLVGLAAAALCARIGLPRIIGMLLAGMLLGPHVLGLLDPSILSISADLRRMALVIILIKAGLSLSINDLRKIGRPALLMSFLPALFELLAVVLLAPRIFGVTVLEAAILGAVLSAVSPAVVVPRMVALIEEKRGTGKAIPQLILAGASLDDVFVIVLFSSFTEMAQGASSSAAQLLQIPVSIALGIAAGAATGWALSSLL
ncbi:MAG: cation:proton antiporter, partial [Candidatus Ventricola sp.]|nr:cation:proton antiporter [Candidatus Ventricola sp.]